MAKYYKDNLIYELKDPIMISAFINSGYKLLEETEKKKKHQKETGKLEEVE